MTYSTHDQEQIDELIEEGFTEEEAIKHLDDLEPDEDINYNR